ncbi:hypothetical protein CLOM_g14269 [Closterium sp. NIES-68]|nr:hypothetical protein CLOM_g14269 [Closterium sp. NIES-68]
MESSEEPPRSGAESRGSSRRKLLEDDFLIPNSGDFRVVLLENAVVWRRTKPSSDKAVQGNAGSPQREASGKARRVAVAEIYAVERLEEAVVKGSLLGPAARLHRLAIHTFRKAADRWTPVQLVLSHADVSVCQQWVDSIQSLLSADPERPRNLLVR